MTNILIKHIYTVIIATFFAILLLQRSQYLRTDIARSTPVTTTVRNQSGTESIRSTEDPNYGCCNLYCNNAIASFLIIAFCIVIVSIFKAATVKAHGMNDFTNVYGVLLFLLAPWGLVTFINMFVSESCAKSNCWWPWLSFLILAAAGIIHPIVKYVKLSNKTPFKAFIHLGNGVAHVVNAFFYFLSARHLNLNPIMNPTACCLCPNIRVSGAKCLVFCLIIWAIIQLVIAIVITAINLEKATNEGEENIRADD